jgi:hypothetical protein
MNTHESSAAREGFEARGAKPISNRRSGLVAEPSAGGDFDFDDNQAGEFAARFYRVVTQ